jgi:hypothetical protein
VAAIWLYAMSGGFPILHERFWANRVWPSAILAAAMLGIFAIWKDLPSLHHTVAASLVACWAAGAGVALSCFRDSALVFGLPLVAAIAFVVGVYLVAFRRRRPQAYAVPALLCGVFLGGSMAWFQRAEDPATRPLNVALPQPAGLTETKGNRGLLTLNGNCSVLSPSGDVNVQIDSLRIMVQPLLTFESTSPDRCWTIFAPPVFRSGPPLDLYHTLLKDDAVWLAYGGDREHILHVRAAREDCHITSYAQVDWPVFSHLNSYCEITVSGHRRLSLAFSPCPADSIEARVADYPIGRPARAAFMTSHGQFRVVEGTSGDKGPYRTLAQGMLKRGDPLTVILYDDGKPVANIRFDDWSAQVATDLSPTAGWGLPANSIEFQRTGDDPRAPVMIWISLAATSLGRGWDSVGHAAGTYRNRIVISQLNRRE